jgi:hypothetical protein
LRGPDIRKKMSALTAMDPVRPFALTRHTAAATLIDQVIGLSDT